jgi:hypothetical protein
MHAQRVLMRLLMVLVLLAGQDFALVHAYTHPPQRAPVSGQDRGLPHGKFCAQCLECSHLAHALPCIVIIPPSAATLEPQALPAPGSHVASLVLGFHSRAPPALL